ncbi:MAG TPA: tetratricopeptide repeat-containing protein kinase family protein, partial [Pirellulales bacterium]|nr:tetratricopeptide repeat-containing protein kinase family protein [Pirellulales bacterium]
NIILGKFGETLIVDWGLAKSLGTCDVPSDGQATTNWIVSGWSSDSGETVAGTAVGTPAFMSPEQAAGRLEDLAPATDVYGLGATLYCLLTGQPPFASGYLGEMLQQVERGEFPRPRSIRPEIPLALEAICVKAMAREPRERYLSAQELAADVDHWLADEPVLARREPPPARLARWARRHRVLVASAAVLFLATTIGLSVGAVLIAREQARTQQAEGEVQAAARMADVQANTANAMSNFLIDMFEEPTPYKLFGQRFGSHKVDPASLATLERGARQLTQQLDDQPLLKAGLLAAIGRAHTGTATFDKAGPLLEQALEIRRRELPSDDPQIADNLEQLGHVYLLEGRTAETERLARECIAIRRARHAESDEGVLTAKAGLGLVLGLTGDDVDEAERMWRDVLAARRKALDPSDLRLAEALMGLAGTVSWGAEVGSVSRPLESSVLLVEAVKILNTHEQIRDLGMALGWAQRAIVFRHLGAHARAADAFKESLNMLTRLLGDDHVLSVLSLHEHAQSLLDAGRRDEVRSCYDGLLAYYEKRGVPFVSAIVESTTLREIAKVRKEAGEQDNLELTLRRVVAKQKVLTGYRSQNDTFVIATLVAILRDQGKTQEAKELVDDYATTLNVLRNLDLIGNVRQRDTIVELLRSVGRAEEAEAVAERSLASLRHRLAPPTQGK